MGTEQTKVASVGTDLVCDEAEGRARTAISREVEGNKDKRQRGGQGISIKCFAFARLRMADALAARFCGRSQRSAVLGKPAAVLMTAIEPYGIPVVPRRVRRPAPVYTADDLRSADPRTPWTSGVHPWSWTRRWPFHRGLDETVDTYARQGIHRNEVGQPARSLGRNVRLRIADAARDATDILTLTWTAIGAIAGPRFGRASGESIVAYGTGISYVTLSLMRHLRKTRRRRLRYCVLLATNLPLGPR